MSQTQGPKERVLQEIVTLLEELKRMGIKSIDVVERPEGVSIQVGNIEYLYDAVGIDEVQIELISHGYIVHRENEILHVE